MKIRSRYVDDFITHALRDRICPSQNFFQLIYLNYAKNHFTVFSCVYEDTGYKIRNINYGGFVIPKTYLKKIFDNGGKLFQNPLLCKKSPIISKRKFVL